MSVEDYLNSIRKNTISTGNKTAKLDSTMRDLLNYESLKKAVSDGVEDANKTEFKRLSDLSKKILLSSDATGEELREIVALLKLYYSELSKKSENGNTLQVPVTSWIQALKEVLDEFGDSLPEKFQRRMKYEIVGAAAQAGANPTVVMQQLNMTQVNQTVIMQNIYEQLKDNQLKIERKAEAEKPKKVDEERNGNPFWNTKMGKVLGFLSDITGKLGKVGMLAGAIYVAIGIWKQLSDTMKSWVKGGALFKTASSIDQLQKLGRAAQANPTLSKLAKSIQSLFEQKSKPIALTDSTKEQSLGTKARALWAKTKVGISEFFKPAQEWISEFGAKAQSFGKKAGTVWNGIGSHLGKIKGASKILGILKGIGKGISVASKILKVIGIAAGAVGTVIGGPTLALVAAIGTAIALLFDFFSGMANTDGPLWKKLLGGIKRAITEFGMIFVDILKGLIVGVNWLFKKVSGKDSKMLSEWITAIDESKEKIRSGWGYADKEKERAQKAENAAIIERPTGTAYTEPSDIVAKSMPHTSRIKGVTLATGEGLNLQEGVVVSSQSADFLKRAGLENERITSGYRKATNARDWTGKKVGVGSVSQSSHASGNKVDIGTADKDAAGLAKTLAKLLKTPGLVKVGVEGPGDKEGKGVGEYHKEYLEAIAILKKQGFSDKEINDKIVWWGSRYSSGKHLDVLIDPKYSGVPAENVATTINSEGSIAAPENSSMPENPLVAELSNAMTTAYNEQIKMFEQGVKAPDQLTKDSSKNVIAALDKLAPAGGGNALTFNKKDDISDPTILGMELSGVIA